MDRFRRLLVFVLLVALAAASVALGSLPLALLLAGLKAAAVGSEYMELRHAHRLHLVGYLGWVALLVAALSLALSP